MLKDKDGISRNYIRFYSLFLFLTRFRLRILENRHWVVSRFLDQLRQWRGLRSRLSLDFEHMCGWPCSGSYSNLRAIDSKSLFLLTRSFISPPPPPLFIDDPPNGSKVLRSVVAHVVYHYQFVFSFFLVVWRS